jgi:hypothetical protein
MTSQERAAYRSRIARRHQVGVPQEADQKITVRVGAVEATVETGPDGRFGTKDDKVTLAKAGTAGYDSMLVKQLRSLAKDQGIPGYSRMVKAELVKVLQEHDATG